MHALNAGGRRVARQIMRGTPMPNERSTLRDEPLGDAWAHVCVDMQKLFAPGSEWGIAWMPKVLPHIVRLSERAASRTYFTRFVPADRPAAAVGAWRRYYRKWAGMTLERAGRDCVRLADELERFVPPAQVVDKRVYSPWLGSNLHAILRSRKVNTLVVTGGETDMCVLATVLGAVDCGYRTILVRDALCSTSDSTHDAMLTLFSTRYGEQVETADMDEIAAMIS